MSKQVYGLFQNVRANPKKTAQTIYELALKYSNDHNYENISFENQNSNDENDENADNNAIIHSFLFLIDQNLTINSSSTRFLSKVVYYFLQIDNSVNNVSSKECCENSNFYVALTTKYLHELYIISENIPDRVECHEKAITNIHKLLVEKNILDKEQSFLIGELKDNLSTNQKSSYRKSKKIIDISSKLKEKDVLDNMQNNLIDRLDKTLMEKEQLDNLQSELINELKTEIAKKNYIDDSQSDLIEKMQYTLSKKEKIDSNQSMLLLKIREELIEKEILDLQQSQSIYNLETIITNHQTQIDLLSKKINFLDKFTIKNDLKFSSVCVKIYFLFAICVIFNILTVLYFCLLN